MGEIEHRDGDVIYLARAPGQVADQGVNSGVSVDRGARSGNSRFDPKTGQFAKKGGKDPKGPAGTDINPVPTTRSDLPQGVTLEQWEKRLDIVRDAARKYSTMSGEDATDFLADKVQDMSQVNVAQFVADVRAHQLDDLVDILDKQLRGKLSVRGEVRLNAPKSWTKRVFAGLSDGESANVVARLSTRGWSEDEITTKVINKFSNKSRKARAKQTTGEN